MTDRSDVSDVRSSPGVGREHTWGLGRLDARLVAVMGALAISLTGVLVALADTTSSTATMFRCALALPVLLALAWRENRRTCTPAPSCGPAARSAAESVDQRSSVSTEATWSRWWTAGRWHLLAGAFLGADMVFWNESIASSGAGVSTVLVNVQVIVVPLIGLAIFGEHAPARFWYAMPALLGGVALAGGALDAQAYGPDPAYGTVTGVLAGGAYAGYLVLLRRAGPRLGPMTMLSAVTLSAGLVGAGAGLATGTLDLTPGPAALGWLVLLALSGQILGWLLVASALPRLTASTGSVLLLIQPVAAVIFGVVLLHERPSTSQVVGCVLVIATVAGVGAFHQHPRPQEKR